MNRLQRSEGFNRIDFYTGIYSALTALVPYHTLLDQQKKVLHIILHFLNWIPSQSWREAMSFTEATSYLQYSL